MKQEQFKSLINECIREVMAEGKVAKKKAALKQIKEIISENELAQSELNELFDKPATDADIDAYLLSRPKDKALLDKDPDRKTKFYAFVKGDKNASKKAKNKEVILAYWDATKKAYSTQPSTASNTATSFGESKKK